MNPKIVIYTAITNNYDELKEPSINHFVDNSDVDFHVFTDGAIKDLSEYTWKLRACTLFSDPCLNAKIHKILPHRFFPYAEYSLWVDGSIEILPETNIQELIDTYLKDADICVFKHPHRDCVYEEAAICTDSRLDKSDVIGAYIYNLKNLREHPKNAGLAECGVILRRHTTKINVLNEYWWDEIATYSKRDQLSFIPAITWLNINYNTFPGHLSTNDNPYFKVHPHLRGGK